MKAPWACHAAAAAACAAVLAAAALAMDAVARRDGGAGTVWVVPRDGAAGLQRVLRGEGLRLVQAWAGGRVLQLHAESLRAAEVPASAARLVWRVPPAVFTLPGCV